MEGFDEFYGNLYHLNAEDEPKHEDYPKDPPFRERFGPRGVLHCKATDVDDPTEDPRYGRVGKQVIEDTDPLTKKRMETIDDDVTERAKTFIRNAHDEGKPFFVWWNATTMHLWTRIKDEIRGISGQGEYNDAMVDHDRQVGELLDLVDELGIAEDTIVMYSTAPLWVPARRGPTNTPGRDYPLRPAAFGCGPPPPHSVRGRAHPARLAQSNALSRPQDGGTA